MAIELVRTVSEDGLRLDGALHGPADGAHRSFALDAFLFIHGTGSNFYSSTLAESIASRLTSAGAAVLVGNTRGHDLMCTTVFRDGPCRGGAAYEVVSDCVKDIRAWLDCLAARGLRRVGLMGHSLGAIKSIFMLSNSAACPPVLPPSVQPSVACLVAISPPRLCHSEFLNGPDGATFREDFARAKSLVEAGRAESLLEIRVPLPYVISARGYLDKYGPEAKYDLLKYVGRVEAPSLYLFGSAETASNVAFRGVPELVALQMSESAGEVATVAGADHFYSGCRRELAARIMSWLGRTIPA